MFLLFVCSSDLVFTPIQLVQKITPGRSFLIPPGNPSFWSFLKEHLLTAKRQSSKSFDQLLGILRLKIHLMSHFVFK